MRTEYIVGASAVVIVGVLLWNKDKITLMKGLPSIDMSYLSPRTPPQYPSPTEDAGMRGYEGVPLGEAPLPIPVDLTSACRVSTYNDWLVWLAENKGKVAIGGADDPDTWEDTMIGIKTAQGCYGMDDDRSGSGGGLSNGQPNQYTPSAFIPSSM